MDMDTVNFTDSQLVYSARKALRYYSTEGDVADYNYLVSRLHLNKNPEDVALLVTCLKTLSGAVSCMDPVHHELLLATICKMSLWNYYSTDVMDALVELLVLLVGSSGQYVDLCLDTLVRNFTPPFLGLLKHPSGQIRKNNVVDHVHSAFKHIHDLVPLSALRLERIIKDRMPCIYTDESLVVVFVENMLRLERSDIGKLVGSTVISMIVDMLVELDVEISWDDILQENCDKGIFEWELEKPEDSEGIELDNRFFKGDILSVAQKLDSLMVLLFEHLKSSSYESGRLLQVFESLLESFQKTVLTAYKSKFAQFVMFYACSLDPVDCGTKFALTLLNIFKSSDSPPELRMSSLAYLASYLSRAKFVSDSVVTDMIESLVGWCSAYCREHPDGVMNPNAHKDFYGACQAIMYVLCFRLKKILADPRLRSVVERVNRVFNLPLNPLKVCLPSIVEEFLRVAKQTPLFALPELVTSDGMLESDLSVAFGGKERLDMFFPFDPCLLKRSESGYIRPIFTYWSMVDNTSDDDNDNDNEATSDEEVDDIPRRSDEDSDDEMMEGSVNDDEDSDVD